MSILARRPARSALGLVPPLLMTVALALAGCGEQRAADDTGGDAAGDAAGDAEAGGADEGMSIAHATGADDVVLSIDTGGGFVPIDYSFTDQPELVLTGDGTLAVPDSGGSTLMAPVAVAALDEEQVQRLLALADDAGLLDRAPSYAPDPRGGQVSDAPTTTVVVAAAGVTRTHAAYALGGAGEGDTPDRERLAGFVDDALALAAETDLAPLDADRVQLLATPANGAPGEGSTIEEWPVTAADLGAGPCLTLDGAAAAVAGRALGGTATGTYFTQHRQTYLVVGVAVLPGDEPGTGCPVGGPR